jgi:alanine racemase
MFETSYIELNLKNLKSNRDFITSLAGKKCEVSSVVKGNAYGHGTTEFVQMAEICGTKHFSVFSADEAFEVYNAAERNPQIMIMGSIEQEGIQWAIEHDVSFYVFDIERLAQAVREAQKQNKRAKIHLELETGMNRTGMEEKTLKSALTFILHHPEHIQVEGVCTHFAGAESEKNHSRIERQMETFNHLVTLFTEMNLIIPKIHTSCSAGLMNYPNYNHDLIRIGIVQYGFWPNNETWNRFADKNKLEESPLKRVISWKSHIMSIKRVAKDDFIGYGSSYKAKKNMIIAIVPVGYSHGFSRSLSNAGFALVRGVKVRVIGIVNMNSIALDISHCYSSEPGDEVVLIGKQGDSEISVKSFSETTHMLNYELLTRSPRNIPRKII